MYTTMRAIAAELTSAPAYSGAVRLYISSRAHESIYAISDLGLSQASFSDDILYVMDWSRLENVSEDLLPRNLLCTCASCLDRPNISSQHNIILVDAAITTDTLRSILFQSDGAEPPSSPYAPQLLNALYSGSLDRLCQVSSTLCGNPILFLGFNYRITTCCLLDSQNPDIVEMSQNGAIGPDLVALLHNRQAAHTDTILTIPGRGTRFLYIPITQSSVHIASILLLEDRVALSEEDFQFLSHIAKCYRLLTPSTDSTGPTRLIYEYTLIRALSDSYMDKPEEIVLRFSSLGYHFKNELYIIVLNSAVEISADVLRQRLHTLVGYARQIVGRYGLCTPLRDHIVVLLNLDSSAPLPRLLSDFRLFCSKNQLLAGLSPCFTDIAKLRHNYRCALDAIGVGSLIWKDENLYVFEELRIYKFIATCARYFPLDDLLPNYLIKLIEYDRENHSDLLESLYYYVYTVKNTKAAAELLHVHRNTLLYRLEKVNSIMEVDLEDGDVFLHLMLAFKFLEFEAKQRGIPLCFTPVTRKPEITEDSI